MKYESEYAEKGFILILIRKWSVKLITIFILCVLIVSSFIYPTYGRKKKFFIDAFRGLKSYEIFHFMISNLIFVILILLLFCILYYDHKSLKMVTELEFNDKKKVVTFHYKDLLNKKYKLLVKYSVLKIELEPQKDGITNNIYDCYVLKNKKIVIGRIYCNHFTWKDSSIIKIIKENIATSS